MTTTLPPLLTAADLPLAELQSAALDGDLFRLDHVFCSVAEFDVPWRRAAALSSEFGREFVVARSSAAWVWGSLAAAPATHEGYRPTQPFSTTPRRDARVDDPVKRWRDSPVGMTVKEVVLETDDVVDFGMVVVTSAVRTVVDLVRGDRWSPDLSSIVHRLCEDHRVDREACDAVLDRRKNLPHKRRARDRLEVILTDLEGGHDRRSSIQPPLTR